MQHNWTISYLCYSFSWRLTEEFAIVNGSTAADSALISSELHNYVDYWVEMAAIIGQEVASAATHWWSLAKAVAEYCLKVSILSSWRPSVGSSQLAGSVVGIMALGCFGWSSCFGRLLVGLSSEQAGLSCWNDLLLYIFYLVLIDLLRHYLWCFTAWRS